MGNEINKTSKSSIGLQTKTLVDFKNTSPNIPSNEIEIRGSNKALTTKVSLNDPKIGKITSFNGNYHNQENWKKSNGGYSSDNINSLINNDMKFINEHFYNRNIEDSKKPTGNQINTTHPILTYDNYNSGRIQTEPTQQLTNPINFNENKPIIKNERPRINSSEVMDNIVIPEPNESSIGLFNNNQESEKLKKNKTVTFRANIILTEDDKKALEDVSNDFETKKKPNRRAHNEVLTDRVVSSKDISPNTIKNDPSTERFSRKDKKHITTHFDGKGSDKLLKEIQNNQKQVQKSQHSKIMLTADITKYNFIKVLAPTNSGKVLLAKNTENNELYAVKCIRKDYLNSCKANLTNLKSEKKVLEKVNFPFICSLLCHFQTNDNIYLVFDYYSGGDLFYYLGNYKKFNEDVVRFYAAEIYLTLSYLHSKGIIYRDLKPENVVLDKYGHIKLVDMGLAKENITNINLTKTICGTYEYIPPEVIKGNKYGFNFDWWCYGILLFELLNGYPPFTDKNKAVLFEKICFNEPNIVGLEVSRDCKDLITKLLYKEVDKRITPDRIASHPWFMNINFNELEKGTVTAPFIPKPSFEENVTTVDKEILKLVI